MDRPSTVQAIRTHCKGILLLFLIVWFLLTNAYRSALSPSPGITGIDFNIYYSAAQRLGNGEPLYIFRPEGDTYVYSPVLALLLKPIAALDYPTALKLWFFIMASCLGASIIIYGRAARFTWRDLALVAISFIVGFRFWPTTMNFSLGQVNFLILLFISAVFWADSRNKPLLVALFIVAAALIKTWMIGLLIYLILRKHWREAAAGALGFAVLLAGSFGLVGWQEWPVFWNLTAGYADQSIGQIAATQSFSGFAHLHFESNHLIEPLLDNPWVFKGFIALGFALMIAGFIQVARRRPAQPSYEARLQLGLVILSLLLMLPMCQTEYFVLCLPLLWTFIAAAPKAISSHLKSHSLPVIIVALSIYALFTRGWPCSPPIPEPYRHGMMSLMVSVNFFAAFALWILTLFAISRVHTRVAAKPSTPVSVS